MGCRAAGESGLALVTQLSLLLPYREVQPKAPNSCSHPTRPSEENTKFPVRFPSDLKP